MYANRCILALCTFAACNNRPLINHMVVNDNENALKSANVSTWALKSILVKGDGFALLLLLLKIESAQFSVRRVSLCALISRRNGTFIVRGIRIVRIDWEAVSFYCEYLR